MDIQSCCRHVGIIPSQMLWAMMTLYHAVEGSIVTFSCLLGLVLIGPSSATCTENGEWKPDPRGLTCRGKFFTGLPYKSLVPFMI